MGEHVVRPIPQKVLTVTLKLVLGCALVRDADLMCGDPVVDDVDVRRLELRGQKAQLIRHVISDRIDVVAVLRDLHERVLEVCRLVAEDVADVESVATGLFHDVVEHRIVAGVFLHDPPHGGHLVGIEDRPETAVGLEDGRQCGRHPHELVSDDGGSSLGGAQRLERRDGRGRQSHVLFILPQVLVRLALDAELLEQSPLEFVDHAAVHIAHVDQQHLGRASNAGRLVEERAPPVDDADVVEAFDAAEGMAVARVDQAVDRGIQDFSVLPQPVLDRTVRREEGADEDRAADDVEIGWTREEAL